MSSSGNTPRQLESGLLNTLLQHPLRPGETQSLLERLGSRLPSTFEQLATLVYVANQVSSTLDLETLLDRIVSLAKEVTRCERGTLFLNDPDSNQLVAQVLSGSEHHEIRIPNTAGIAGSVFTSGQPVLIPDAYADPRFNQNVDKQTGYRTRNILCAPIRTRSDEIIGVMQLLNCIDGDFAEDNLLLLEAVTSQAAVALTNARMLEQIKRAREEEAHMHDVVTSISSELQLRPLLQKIVGIISDLLEADRSTVFLNDKKTNELFSFLAQGLGTQEIRFPNHLGIAGTVFTSGETMSIPDAYADPRFNQNIDKQTGYRTRTILCMPIRNREGKKLGVTQVVNKHNGPFTKNDERKLEAFTSQVAIAIENATLFDEVATIKNYNESMLESMTNGLMTLDEDGRVQKCNQSFLRIFKTAPEDVLGQLSDQYFTGKNAWIQDKIAKVGASDVVDVAVDAEVILGERHKLNLNLNTVPLKGGKGERLGTMLVFEDITTEKRVKSTMARYMAKEVAEKLLEGGQEALGGVCQKATVLFSDIRSFTSLSEKLGPQETVAMLNEYFTVMVDCVVREGGILDKFIGDALMALFGVPFPQEDDADRAVRAAIAMLRDLRALNSMRVASGRPPIHIGIGVNTDEVVSGNIGSLKRMDYTAIGDGVNLASRLESSCKTYGTCLVISEFTRNALHQNYRLREVDRVIVKGKTAPVALFEVMDYYDDASFPQLSESLAVFQEAMNAYRLADFERALALFNQSRLINPADTLSIMYADRCQHFLSDPPAANWNGVWVMATK
jgi:adenylate cyclase